MVKAARVLLAVAVVVVGGAGALADRGAIVTARQGSKIDWIKVRPLEGHGR